MSRSEDGWFKVDVPTAHPGFLYKFRIDGDAEVPDPASSYQPRDVHGPSELIDHSYDWKAVGWRGRPWSEAVIYELHIGTFTPEGTFRSAIERLDYLADLGFTAIELMPVADFFGRRNWGYDGVLWYAPDSAYGRPEDLKSFVDEAHARGLMVFLDVVYNHFGPEGNYLSRYAPQFFAQEVETPWGAAIDYDVPEVRAFAIENALHWLDHYRFDGLRLDAVHAITKRGAPSVLEDLSKAVGEFAEQSGRKIHLVLENDDNEAPLLDPSVAIPAGRYRAQWNDDYHHAWHVLLTGERAGYYADYSTTPLEKIARSLTSGFVYQGEPSGHRGGAKRGSSSEHLPPTAFVNFLQNHDQIGNRALGDRLSMLAGEDKIAAALAILLLAPSPPLLFMGEEWGSTSPFAFFCQFEGELADAVRAGRKREFAAAYNDLGNDAIPDALEEATFLRSALNWDDTRQDVHFRRLDLVKKLLAARSRWIFPLSKDGEKPTAGYKISGTVLDVKWAYGAGDLQLRANLSEEPGPLGETPGQVIWSSSSPAGGWSVQWNWHARV